MAMELKHLNQQHVMDVTGKAIDEISRLRAENAELKAEINYKEGVGLRWFERCMEARTENVKLKRALWLSREWRALCEIDYWRKCYEHADDYFDVRTGQDLEAKRCERMISKWIDVKSKCLKKAEEYK